MRAAYHAREWAKQKRVRASIQEAREGLPPAMNLRSDHDGSPEYTRIGTITKEYQVNPADKFAVVYIKGHQYKVQRPKGYALYLSRRGDYLITFHVG